MVTNTSADIVWSSEYTPFGLLAKQEGDYDFQKAEKFTGKDLDQDTGLYYYNARWYYAEIGRFISADSYKGELENPQTINLYVYVLNNPIKYTDPTGNVAEEVLEDIKSQLPEGVTLEDGSYDGLEYYLLKINLENNTNISFDTDISLAKINIELFLKI